MQEVIEAFISTCDDPRSLPFIPGVEIYGPDEGDGGAVAPVPPCAVNAEEDAQFATAPGRLRLSTVEAYWIAFLFRLSHRNFPVIISHFWSGAL